MLLTAGVQHKDIFNAAAVGSRDPCLGDASDAEVEAGNFTRDCIATWYPVPATDITFQVTILVLRRKSVAEPVFLPTILEVTPSLDGLWATPVISTPLGGVSGWFDWLVEAGAETLVLI